MLSEQVVVATHYGNGSATQFNFNFYIKNASELKVTYINADGNRTVLTCDTDYSIAAVGNANGSYITYPKTGSTHTTLATNETLVIELVLPIEQETEYDQNYLNFKNVENSFDYITRVAQMIARKVSRAISVAEGLTVNLEFDKIVNGGYLKWKSDGSGIESDDIMSNFAAVALSGSYHDLVDEPTKLSDFTDDLGSSPTHTHSQYLTAHQDITGKQDKSNLVTSVSASSTDSQYPSAKLFYDTVGNIETLINNL